MTILVCFAVPQEARFFHATQEPHRIVTCITGMGRSNAERALEDALSEHRPNLVFTCGFAGGLNPSLATGAIVFEAEPGSSIEAILLKLKAVPARFLCANRIATKATEKRNLWQHAGADAIEMESASIRQLCQQRQLPSATIRVILDTAAEDLPLDFNKVLNEDHAVDYSKLIGRVLASPGKILPLIAFQRQTLIAARRLGSTLDRVIAAMGRAGS